MVLRPSIAKKSDFFFKNSFSFLIKTTHFTQKWNFFIRVYILICCPSLSRVSHNSTQKNQGKIRHFIKVYDSCYKICSFWFWHVFIKITVFHLIQRYLLKQFQLMTLVWLPNSFTPIPHSSYLSLFFIRTYKWKLGIVSFLSSIYFLFEVKLSQSACPFIYILKVISSKHPRQTIKPNFIFIFKLSWLIGQYAEW